MVEENLIDRKLADHYRSYAAKMRSLALFCDLPMILH